MYCLNVGGVQIDQAVVEAFLRAVTPAAALSSPLVAAGPCELRIRSINVTAVCARDSGVFT